MNKQASTSTSSSTASVSQDVTASSATNTTTNSIATLCANNDCDQPMKPNNHMKSSFFKIDPMKGVEFRYDQEKCDQKQAALDEKFWWNKTRIHVALLGLLIAAVNCYAQATFCIAIVEMILPADYVVRSESDSGPNQQHQNLAAATTINLNQTLGMEHPTEPILYLADQSCPIELQYRDYYDDWRFPQAATVTTNKTITPANNVLGQLSNQATTTTTTSSNSLIDISNRFDWDAQQQGLLLGAFAVGTAPLQVIGGRLAEIYGSKWVLLMGCIGTALTNLTIPYIAHFSFVLLLLNRVVMGVAQAGMEPGLMCLLADWLTPQEAGFFISMLLFAICVGFFLGSLCSSFILALGYGWPLTYYVAGSLNLIVALIWYIYADSWPHASKYIKQNELDYIIGEQKRQLESKQQQQPQDQLQTSTTSVAVIGSRSEKERGGDLNDDNHNSNISTKNKRVEAEEPPGATKIIVSPSLPVLVPVPAPMPLAPSGDPINAPWLNILATPSVWAFIICKISIRWCADVLANELPLYLANVLHLSIKINGLLNSMSAALFAISSFVSGWLANEIIVRKSLQQYPVNKTLVRKTFQSMASFGSAICLILMTRYDCDIMVSMSMLLILSCCLVMGTGGELQIPYDMTSRYPGTLHGMACTLSVSGWLAPPLIGLILADQPNSRHRWSIVWYSTAAITMIGGLVFVLFADASPRDFDRAKRRTSSGRKVSTVSRATDYDDDDLKRHSNNQSAAAAYTNSALSNSSCENSPKSKHSNYLLHTEASSYPTSVLSDKLQQQQPIEVPTSEQETMADSKRPVQVATPLDQDQRMLFDSDKLVKLRQLESSFIRPGSYNYPMQHNLDSLIDRDASSLIMLPYREDPSGVEQQQYHTRSSSLNTGHANVNSSNWHQASLGAAKVARVATNKNENKQDLS